MEVALLVASAKADLGRDRVLDGKPEVREVAFDPQTKVMTTYHEEGSQYRVAVKGAYEAVADASSRLLNANGEQDFGAQEREAWREKNEQMARHGMRVLALATKTVETPDADPYQDLTFQGLVGLLDPPREDVRPSLEAAKQAGVDVVMVTGDQRYTARNVAMAVGLVDGGDTVEVVHGRELKPPEELSQEERERVLW